MIVLSAPPKNSSGYIFILFYFVLFCRLEVTLQAVQVWFVPVSGDRVCRGGSHLKQLNVYFRRTAHPFKGRPACMSAGRNNAQDVGRQC